MTRTRATARAAGTRLERLVADYLAAHVDPRIDRRPRTGAKDRGDVSGLRHMGGRLVIECKDVTRWTPAEWLTEAETERGNDDALAGLVVAKRRGKADPGDQLVMCTLADLAALLTGTRPGDPDAEVMVRRSERALGQAIRDGQERGEIASVATHPRVNRYEASRDSANSSTTDIPAATDFVPQSDLSGNGGAIYAMTDGVTDEDFEAALAEAQCEGNVSRANVVRKPADDPSPRDTCTCGHVRRIHGARPGLDLPDDRCRACTCERFEATR